MTLALAAAAVGGCDLLLSLDELEGQGGSGAGGNGAAAGGGAGGGGGVSGGGADSCAAHCSGVCIEQLCCDTACEGPCQSCNLPDQVGTCTPLPAGPDVDPACEGSCDGAGSCVSGAPRWLLAFGAESTWEEPRSVALGPDGTIALVGMHDGPWVAGNKAIAHEEDWDAFVLKVDDEGKHLWADAITGSLVEVASAVVADASHVFVGVISTAQSWWARSRRPRWETGTLSWRASMARAAP